MLWRTGEMDPREYPYPLDPRFLSDVSVHLDDMRWISACREHRHVLTNEISGECSDSCIERQLANASTIVTYSRGDLYSSMGTTRKLSVITVASRSNGTPD